MDKTRVKFTDLTLPLMPGDIGAVKGSGIFGWLSKNLLKPHTDRYHFFMIGDYMPWYNDWVILESIGKGPTVGRLSFYNPDDIEIYRVVLDSTPEDRLGRHKKFEYDDTRRRAAAELTEIGRARYDYILYLQMIAGALQLMFSGRFPPYDPAQLPYGRNRAYICTEAANYGWRKVGHPIIRGGVVPVPAGFKQALLEGRLTQIYP